MRSKILKKLAALLLAAALCLSLAGCDMLDYSKATKLLDSGDYAAALEIFEELGDHKDSVDKANECRYQLAVEALDNDDVDGAEKLLAKIPGYKDSAELTKECSYRRAVAAMDKGDLETAIKLFGSLDVYKDSVKLKREAEETLATKNLVGTWYGTGDATAALKEATEGYIENASYNVTIIFLDDGSYNYILDLSPSVDALHDAMRRYFEDELAVEGLSVAIFEAYLGQSLDDYIDYSITNELELTDYGFGSYSFDNGVLYLDPGTSGEIVVDYDGSTMGLETALGPATLTKSA